MQKKSFNAPDETMTLPKTKVEIVNIGGGKLIRNTFEPGWQWSIDVGPAAGTKKCEMHHVTCVISGHLRVVMNDGSEIEIGSGDIADIPAGHDSWVIGDEPVVAIDVGQAQPAT